MKTNYKTKFIIFFLLTGIGIFFPVDVFGAFKVWNGGSGDWSVAGNWTPNGVPAAIDSVSIPQGNIVTISTNVGSIHKIQLNGKLTISAEGSLNVEQYSEVKTKAIFDLNGGELVNNGTLTIKQTMANTTTVVLQFSENISRDDKFTNSGILTIDNLGSSNDATTGRCVSFNQTSSTRTSRLTMGGTMILNVKTSTRFIEVQGGKAELLGTAIIGSDSDFKNWRFIHMNATGTTLTIAATANITLYSGFNNANGIINVQTIANGNCNFINNGKLTFYGGSATIGCAININPQASSTTATNATFTNAGTITIEGNFPTGSIFLSGTGFAGSVSTFINSGTLDITNTSTAATAAALRASTTGPVSTFNNTGIATFNSSTATVYCLLYGNGNSIFNNTGAVTVKRPISGYGSTTACIINNNTGGVFNFDVASSSVSAVNSQYRILFKNDDGTIKGRGRFSSGTFVTMTGTIDPGIGTGIGVFIISDATYNLTGTCMLNLNGKATAGSDYDQIVFSYNSAGAFTIDPTASIEVTTGGSYIPTHLDNIPLITSYVGRVNTFTPANITKPVNWIMDYSTTNASLKYLAPSLSVTASTNVSTLGDLTNTDLTLNPGNQLTLDATTTIKSIIALPGSKITLSSGSPTINGLTLQSDASGTATFIDNNNVLPQIISATVQQYLSSARNWYLTSPISGATVPTGQTYYSYDETGGNTGFTGSATAYWVAVPQSTLIDPMKGYIAQPAATTTKSYTGTLNSGTQTIELTRTNSASKPGFNLVANPYPSYLDWQMVDTAATNILSTVWYRTKTADGDYTFDTYNGGLLVATSNGENTVTKLIPPMQAFWVRIKSGFTGGTLTFDNTMRKHVDNVGNKFKAPALSETQLVRLRVSNGANSDETLICFNPKATNGYDSYDSPKMSNNSASIPEIYTQAGTEKLVINGMTSVQYDTEFPLGFTTGQVNDFSISNTEMTNFEVGTRVILKDKLLNTETELGEGVIYSFSSQPTTPTTDRFSVLFRAPSLSTGFESTENHNAQVFVNAANQITIIAIEKSNYAIFNTLGQNIKEGLTVSNRTSINNKFESGMYLVTVTKHGKSFSTRVVLNGK